MSETTYKERHSRVEKLLSENSFFHAIDLLLTFASEAKLPAVASKLLAINSSYSMMSEYALKGMPDPSREEMHSQLSAQLHHINDTLLREALTNSSSDSFYEAARFSKSSGKTLRQAVEAYLDFDTQCGLAQAAGADSAALLADKEAALLMLFRIVWTLQPDVGSLEYIKEICTSDAYPFELKAQIVSAITLNLLKFYDSGLLILLIDIYGASTLPAVQAMSLIGVVLAISLHNRRAASDTALHARLLAWEDNILVYTHLREVVRNIIKARDTDRLSTKMKEEILPEIMKLSPEIIKKMRDESSFSDVADFDNNPEWEELLNKNGVADKLRELSELQADGSDVMMPAFSNLKNFRFFNQVNNWFLPFTPIHSALGVLNDGFKPVFDMLALDTGLCDSDKYSLMLSITGMPESQRSMFISQLDGQMTQMAEMVKDSELKNPAFNREVSKHLKDLYRFFRLYRKKEDFHDPFRKPFDFLSLSFIGETLNDADTLRLISEFYFRHTLYAEALPLFRALEEADGNEPQLWEKIGFCLQQTQDYQGALNAYSRAELLREPSEWLLKKLAFINKKLGNYEDAARHYGKLLDSDADNVGLLMNRANCSMHLGKTHDALMDYYHADYISPDNVKICRAMAWAETLSGEFDKASKSYDRLLLQSKLPADYLNAGHSRLIQGDIAGAYSHYKNALAGSDNDRNSFERVFRDDIPTLERNGVKRLDIDIILDNLLK